MQLVIIISVILAFNGVDEQQKISKGSLRPVPIPVPAEFGRDYAKSTVFSEDFESGGGDWTVIGGTWEIGIPSSGPGSAYNGINCAATVLDGNYSNNISARLISPTIFLPSLSRLGTHIELTFWHWFRIESGYDYGYVEISTDGGNSWTQIGSSFSGDGSSWREYSANLDSYAGQYIQLAFHFTSDYSVNYEGWYVDDVAISLLEPEPINIKIVNVSIGMFPFVFLTVRVDTFDEPIYSLDETNFQVFENGALQTGYFEVTPPDTGVGVRAVDIVFVFDTTGSMEEEIGIVRDHVIEFVDSLPKNAIGKVIKKELKRQGKRPVIFPLRMAQVTIGL